MPPRSRSGAGRSSGAVSLRAVASALFRRAKFVLLRLKTAMAEWLGKHSQVARRILWARGNRPSEFVLAYLSELSGIEIGGSAHNDYRLDAINVDRFGDEDAVDFVFASHVLEHFPDPIRALKEWLRVARKYVVLVIPHRDRTFDRDRELTPVDELLRRHQEQIEDPRDLHWSVWTLESFLDLCERLGLRVVDTLDPDDKVGNGFMVILDASLTQAARPTRTSERG